MPIQTATNPTTGERVALIDGAWAPIEKTATNPQTGEQLGLVNGQWASIGAAKQPAIPQEDREGFGAAAAASLARMEGERALVKGKSGLISDDEAMRIYNAQKAEAERLFSPTDDTFSFRNLAELAGGSLPYMAAPIAAGVAGSVVGTPAVGIGASFAASAAQFSGSNLARQIDEGKSLQEASGGQAIAAALPMAALDTFALGKIPGVRQILGRAGIEVSEDAAAAIARKGVANAAIDYTQATGKALTYEGVTEAGQQFFERLQAGLNIGDEAARSEYFDSFIGGALLGGAIAPAGRFIERRGAQKDVEAKQADTKSKALEDQVIAAQQEEEALAAARDVDPDASIDELLREQATLTISGATDPLTRARLAALNAAIRPQLAGSVEARRAQAIAEQEAATQEEQEAAAQAKLDAAQAKLDAGSAFRQAQPDAQGNYLPRPAPQVGPTSPAFPMQQPLFSEEDMTGFRTPTFDIPPQSPRPKIVQPKALQRSLGLRGGQTVKPVTAEDIAALGVSNQANSAWLQANVVGKTPGDIRTLIDNNPNLVAGNGELASTLKALAAPAIETAAPTPEGALSLQDLVDTNVPMKTSKGWFEANVVGKTLEDVQALVTADPTLIEGKGQRAKVLREILAPKPPAFEEAPRGLSRPDTTEQPELGPTIGPAPTELTIPERPADQPSVGVPDAPAVAEQPTVGELPAAPAEPAASEQPGVVSTGLPAGTGDAQPTPSKKRPLKPVRAAEIEVGQELQKWRNARSRVKTPGALVGNAEVEAFLYAIDRQDVTGAQAALDDIAKVLRSLPKGGNQAARAFVEYMNRLTNGDFDRPLSAAFDRIREIPSAPAPVQATEAQDRTRRKPVVDKKYLEPVRITKDNLVVRGSQRLLVPMNDVEAKKYLVERGLDEAERKLDAIDAAKPKRPTPQAGQRELDFTAKQPEPKPVEAKKPEPVEAKKPEPKTPEWVTKFANNSPGYRPILVTDNTAVVTTFNLSGQPVLSAVKHTPTQANPDSVTMPTAYAIYKGDLFTAEERVALDTAIADLSIKRAELDAKYPDGKFSATDANVKATPSMEPYAKFVEGLLKQLGLNDQRVILIASGEARSDPLSFGMAPSMEWFDAPIDEATQGAHRTRRDNPKVSGITINPSVLATGDRQLILEVIAHEIGHMIEHRALASASPEVRAGLQKAHEAWLRQQKGKTAKELVEALRNRKMAETQTNAMSLRQQEDLVDRPASREMEKHVEYLKSFSEWFADNVSRWTTTNEKPVGLIEKFFVDVAKQLRKLASIVTGKRFMPDRAVAKFLNEMGAMDVTSVNSALGGQIENFARTPSMDAIVESSELAQAQPGPVKRAMGLMVDAFSDTAGIDFADKFRTLTVDSGASAERRLNVLFDGAVRSSKGIVNPMGLYRQAQDTTKLLLDWFIDGSLVKDKLTGLYNTAQSKTSMKSVLEKVDAWGNANGYEFKEAYNTISKALEAKRLNSLREENKRREDRGEEPFGINPLSKKREQDGVSADKQIDEALAFNEKHKDAIDEIQAGMDAIRFSLIDQMVAVGRLTAKQGKEWKDTPDYMPFDRIADYAENYRTKKSTGHGISQLRDLPEFVGSEKREVGNIFDNFVKTSGWMIEQTLKQDANISTLKMLERLGKADRRKSKTGIDPAKMVPAFDKGEQVFYALPSRWDVMAFKDLAPPKGALVNFLAGFSNVLRTLITAMPPFAVRQVVNDIQRAYATSGVEQPLKLVYPALRNFFAISGYEIMGKRHPSVREFGQKGVVGDYDFNTRDPMASILYDLGYQSRGKVKGLLHRLEGITRASDLAVRKAIYDQTMREKNDKLLATTRSREFINFRRRGASEVLPALSSTIPFFNAYLQGMDVLYRAATGKSSSSGLDKAAAKRIFATKITQMAAFSTIYAIMSSGEDYYDEAGLQVRHNNWMLPDGIRFPVPEELGAIFKVPAEMMVEYFMRNGTKEEMEAADATFTALKYAFAQYSPVGGRMTPIPAAIKPVIEAVTNYSFFTGRELEGVYQRGQLLPSQRTRAGTSELAKAISKFTESIVGENNAVSPIMIDNTLQGYFGSVAGIVTMGTDQLLNPDRMDRPIQKYWMLSNFLYDPIGTRRSDEFYELRSKTFGVKGTLAKLAKEDPDAAVKFAEEHVNELTLAQGIGASLAQLSDTRRFKNYLNSDLAAQEMSQDERTAYMEETRRMEQELVSWVREVQADLNKSK